MIIGTADTCTCTLYAPNLMLIQDFLLGDYSKAKAKLGWEPTTSFKVSLTVYIYIHTAYLTIIFSFQELVKEMVTSDIKLLQKNPTA